MRRAFAMKCAAAVIVTATTAGCTASAATEPSGNKGPGRDLTDAEQIVVERAEETLVRECMAAKGFKYWVWRIASVDERRSYAYVLDDVAWVKKHGYGGRLVKAAEKARAADPNAAYYNKFPRTERIRYTRAMEGMPSDTISAELPGGARIEAPASGCQAEAKAELYGGYETWFRVSTAAENLTSLFVPALTADKRFVNAEKAWSSCMREAGHDYRSPGQLREELPALTKGLSDVKAHAVEVALATDEAVCASSGESGLADTARGLEREYREQKLKRYADAVATYRQMQRTALAHAEDITGVTA
ncbi:hypothetical protein [Streptomyces sp. SA15]|uniref:hypothetical protein n=1 Tax=Streptomyces sp. SA15 TaxID=934019 RepID=UPI00211C8AD0|nr:hypothetical protein [Streptomyces sp. SA15]